MSSHYPYGALHSKHTNNTNTNNANNNTITQIACNCSFVTLPPNDENKNDNNTKIAFFTRNSLILKRKGVAWPK